LFCFISAAMSSFAEMEFKAFKSTFETKVQMLWKIFEKELQCVRSEVREARSLLDTTIKEKTSMEEDVDQLKVDVGELKDVLTNSKGEVNHIRSGLGDVQEALKNHDSWMEDVSNTLRQMQEKDAQSELNSLQKLIDQHDEQLSTFREESAQRQEAAQKELNSLQMLVGQHDERLRALPEDLDRRFADLKDFVEGRVTWLQEGVQVMLEDMDQARCCEDFRQQCGGLEVGSAPVEQAIHWQESPRRSPMDSLEFATTDSPWSCPGGRPTDKMAWEPW